MKNIHIWECAKAKVKIDAKGKILSVGTPLIEYCPIREYSGWHSSTLTKEDVRKSIQWKIDSLGLCTRHRVVYLKFAGIGYGASECLMTALDSNLIEVGVIPCDGAGTIISSDKFIIQGIGMAMPALLHTIPIRNVIIKLKKRGVQVLDEATAPIAQVDGVKKAIELGYKKIGVTIAGPDCKDIQTLRQIEKAANVKLLIVLIHTSGVTADKKPYIIESDICHGCSSKFIRKTLASQNHHIAKFGGLLPVYAFTEYGKQVLELRDKEMIDKPPLIQVKNKAIRHPPFPWI
ncbi:MAG: DUF2099 family protein [Candidatus Helarchaeota archaeon]